MTTSGTRERCGPRWPGQWRTSTPSRAAFRGRVRRYQKRSRLTLAERDAAGNGIPLDGDAVEMAQEVAEVAGGARLRQLERRDVDADAEVSLGRTHTREAWPLRRRAT